MSKNLTIKDVSILLLSKPWWVVSELQEQLDISDIQLKDLIEKLYPKFMEVGIHLELIDLHSKEYLVVFVESKVSNITEVQLALLVIFGLQIKAVGGPLSNKEMVPLINHYFNELQSLLQEKFIEKTADGHWSITPIGAITIFPHLDESIPFIFQLTDSE